MRIKDKILQPFEIEVDSDSYTLIKKSVAKESGKENEQTIGYFTKLSTALERVVKEQIVAGPAETVTLTEYITAVTTYQKLLIKLIKI